MVPQLPSLSVGKTCRISGVGDDSGIQSSSFCRCALSEKSTLLEILALPLVKPGGGFGFNRCGKRSCHAPVRLYRAELMDMAGPSVVGNGLRVADLMPDSDGGCICRCESEICLLRVFEYFFVLVFGSRRPLSTSSFSLF